jgi:hypothetical protein
VERVEEEVRLRREEKRGVFVLCATPGLREGGGGGGGVNYKAVGESRLERKRS